MTETPYDRWKTTDPGDEQEELSEEEKDRAEDRKLEDALESWREAQQEKGPE